MKQYITPVMWHRIMPDRWMVILEKLENSCSCNFYMPNAFLDDQPTVSNTFM